MSDGTLWIYCGVGLSLGIGLATRSEYRKEHGPHVRFHWSRKGLWAAIIAFIFWALILAGLMQDPMPPSASSIACNPRGCSQTLYVSKSQGAPFIGVRINTPDQPQWKAVIPTLSRIWRTQLRQETWSQQGRHGWTKPPLLTVDFFSNGGVRAMAVTAMAQPSWTALAQQNPGFSATAWMELLVQPALIATIHVTQHLPTAWQHQDFASTVNYEVPPRTIRASWFASRATNGTVMAATFNAANHTVWSAPATVPKPLKMSLWTFARLDSITNGPCTIADVLLHQRLCVPSKGL